MPGTTPWAPGGGPAAGDTPQFQLMALIADLAVATQGLQDVLNALQNPAAATAAGSGAASIASTGANAAPAYVMAPQPALMTAAAVPAVAAQPTPSPAPAPTPARAPAAAPAPTVIGGGLDVDALIAASPLPRVGRDDRSDASTDGLTAAAKALLPMADLFGLRFSSGHRPGATVAGTSGTPSRHGSGRAIDVTNSSTPSAEMDAFANAVRGQPGVHKVIYNRQIASADSNWEWRPFNTSVNTPGMQHTNHVHVSVS